MVGRRGRKARKAWHFRRSAETCLRSRSDDDNGDRRLQEHDDDAFESLIDESSLNFSPVSLSSCLIDIGASRMRHARSTRSWTTFVAARPSSSTALSGVKLADQGRFELATYAQLQARRSVGPPWGNVSTPARKRTIRRYSTYWAEVGLNAHPGDAHVQGAARTRRLLAYCVAYFGSTMVFDEPSGAACMPGGD
jgi:hypothetical protein